MIDISKDNKPGGENQALSKEIEEMYEAGVHFGYSRSSRCPAMAPYFFALRNNVEIFNLEKTYERLGEAMNFLKELSVKGSSILLISTKPEAKDIIEKISQELEMPYVTERWVGGTLTNFGEIKKQIQRRNEFSQKKESGEFSTFSKKEASRLDKLLGRMEKRFGGLNLLTEIPSALVVVDPKEEKSAIAEAKKKNVPIVAIMNSDCNPSDIDFPIPANDTSVGSIEYLLGKLAEAYKQGKKKTPNTQ